MRSTISTEKEPKTYKKVFGSFFALMDREISLKYMGDILQLLTLYPNVIKEKRTYGKFYMLPRANK